MYDSMKCPGHGLSFLYDPMKCPETREVCSSCMTPWNVLRHKCHVVPLHIDCSQSPIFSWDRLDTPLLTVTAILIFKCIEGAGVGDYSSGGGGSEKNFSRFLPNRPRPLGSFDTHARWVARNAKLSISMILRKNRGLWTVYSRHSFSVTPCGNKCSKCS